MEKNSRTTPPIRAPLQGPGRTDRACLREAAQVLAFLVLLFAAVSGPSAALLEAGAAFAEGSGAASAEQPALHKAAFHEAGYAILPPGVKQLDRISERAGEGVPSALFASAAHGRSGLAPAAACRAAAGSPLPGPSQPLYCVHQAYLI